KLPCIQQGLNRTLGVVIHGDHHQLPAGVSNHVRVVNSNDIAVIQFVSEARFIKACRDWSHALVENLHGKLPTYHQVLRQPYFTKMTTADLTFKLVFVEAIAWRQRRHSLAAAQVTATASAICSSQFVSVRPTRCSASRLTSARRVAI